MANTSLSRRSARDRGGAPSIFSVDPMSSLREEFDQLLSNWFMGSGREMRWAFSPSFDLSETDTEYLVQADLPGVNANELNVQVSDNVLTISGERKYEKTDAGEKNEKDKKGGDKNDKNAPTTHFVERYHGTFSRSIVLPGTVEQDKIDAEYHDGVLTVKLPKGAEDKPRQISIKT